MTEGPLIGLRVLELGQIIAGTYGGMLLADLGADVIKVEPPGGDLGRNPDQATVEGYSAIHLTMNRGKRSIAIDLKRDAGRTAFYDLVRKSDVVVDNFRPDVLARLHIDYATLSQLNPRIICCSVSGFGTKGPDRNLRSFDLIQQAMSGHMSLTGAPGGPPARDGIPLADLSGAIFSVPAILAAVIQRQSTGRGQRIELSMMETMTFLLTYDATVYLNTGYVPHAWGSAHAYAVPWQGFATADGWIVVATREERLWGKFCRAIQHAELVDDPRYARNVDRVVNRESLVSMLEKVLLGRTTSEWLAIFRREEVPAGPVNTLAEALSHPTLGLNDGIVEVQLPNRGTARMLANPIRLGETAFRAYGPAPNLGQHTRAILRDLAEYDESKVAGLLADSVVFEHIGREHPDASFS